jgi:hypothetical protein
MSNEQNCARCGLNFTLHASGTMSAAYLERNCPEFLGPKCPACDRPCSAELADILRRLIYVQRTALEHLATTHPEIAETLETLVEPRRSLHDLHRDAPAGTPTATTDQ